MGAVTTPASACLVVTLGGVQEFVAASRRTADLWCASRVMSRLCQVAAQAVEGADGVTVIPASAESVTALPNRLFAIVPPQRVAEIGRAAEKAVRDEWVRLASLTHGRANQRAVGVDADLATFPTVRWVGWEPQPGYGSDDPVPEDIDGSDEAGYGLAWRTAGAAVTARKRIRDFAAYTGRSAELCSLCGRRDGRITWPRLRVSRGERLCAVCAVKRDPRVVREVAQPHTAFPSTASVATAAFRASVLGELARIGVDSPLGDAVREHRRAVRNLAGLLAELGAEDPDDPEIPGVLPALEALVARVDDPSGEVRGWSRLDGAWCYPDTWLAASLMRECGVGEISVADTERLTALCRRGATAAAGLTAALEKVTDEDLPPAIYLGLVMLDGDDMGASLSDPLYAAGPVPTMRGWHTAISSALTDVAGEKSRVFDDGFGRAVYAGGDDILGLAPAVSALATADRCRQAFTAGLSAVLARPTVSGAVVFFHHSFPLQEAVRRGRDALAEAKSAPGKNHLAVVAIRRGGERARGVLPWEARGAVAVSALTALADYFAGSLSPRLLADLLRERSGLAELAREGRRHRGEVARLVARHQGGEAAGGSRDAVGASGDDAAGRVAADAGRAGAGRRTRALVVGAAPLDTPTADRPAMEAAELVDYLAPAGLSRPRDVVRWVETLELARFLAQEGR